MKPQSPRFLVVSNFRSFCGEAASPFTKRVNSSCETARTGRRGFTLIEVLVSIGIIGILLSLMIPAVQSSREAARRLQCSAKLRQLGLACAQYHEAHNCYPPGFGYFLSTFVHLLPHLDEADLFDRIDMAENGVGTTADPPYSTRNQDVITRRVIHFECPSDRAPAGATNYRECMGIGPSVELGGREGVFVTRFGTSVSNISDGASCTALYSERLVGDLNSNVYTPWRDYFLAGGMMRYPADAEAACRLPAGANPNHISFGGMSWLYSGFQYTFYNHIFTPNSVNPDCGTDRSGDGAMSARSLHSSGVNVVFADGSTRFISDSIDLSVWRALGSSNGGEPIASKF